MEIKISVLFRTTHLPTGATYLGVHDTPDMGFGTNQYRDPYLGNGAKLVDLIRLNGGNRRLFRVDCLMVGTRQQVEERLKNMLADLNYADPKTLNSQEGAPKGTVMSQERREHQSRVMVGNDNALGQKGPTIDIDAPANTKLKWFNDGESQQKMILCDAENNPIKEQYKGWKLGKLHANPYVNKRIQEARDANKANSSSGDKEATGSGETEEEDLPSPEKG